MNKKTKKCKKCGEVKTVKEFYSMKTYLSGNCKQCSKELSKQWAFNNKKRKKVLYKKWYSLNREEHLERLRERNKEYKQVEIPLSLHKKLKQEAKNKGWTLIKLVIEKLK